MSLREEEFLGLIRARLEVKVGAMMNADERSEGRRIPGMRRIRDWKTVWIDFEFAYRWKTDLDEMRHRAWGTVSVEKEIGAARLLNGLHLRSEDKKALIQLLLPVVTRERVRRVHLEATKGGLGTRGPAFDP